MIFYSDIKENWNNIPDIYKIGVMSNSKIVLNRVNSIDCSIFLPNFTLTTNKDVNKKRYLNQLKDNEEFLVSIFYAINTASDPELGTKSNMVFICNEQDLEKYGFNYMKIFRKFIRKKYGVKVFELTYDVTPEMISDSEMDEDGVDRYIEKLMYMNKKINKQ